MFKRVSEVYIPVALFLGWCNTGQVLAQDISHSDGSSTAEAEKNQWHGLFGAGLAMLPEYDGADDYEFVPFIIVDATRGPFYIEFRGLEALANIVPDTRFNAGPLVNIEPGRDEDMENEAVARMRPLDDAIEVGGFVRYNVPNVLKGGDAVGIQLQAAQDVTDGHDGMISEFEVEYSLPASQRWYLEIDANVSYGDESYMQALFGVDAVDASRSGLSPYEAGAGLVGAGVGITVNYALGRRWGILGVASYTQLLGDAADSPLVDDEGSASQYFGGLAVSYGF